MFPDAYAKNGARIEEGKLALIHGTTNRRDGELSLTAYDIFDLENSIPRIIPLRDSISLLSLCRSATTSTPALRSRKKVPNGVTDAGRPVGASSDCFKETAPTIDKIEFSFA